MRTNLKVLLAITVLLALMLGACAPGAAPETPVSPVDTPAPPAAPADTQPADTPAAPADTPAAPAEEPTGFVVPDELRGGEIVIYSSFPDEQIAEWAEPFTALTDIRVLNVVISSGEGLSRIRAEAANPQADFWLSVRGALLQDALENDPPLIIEYKPRTVDEIAQIYQYPDSTFFTGVGTYPLVIFYNTQVLQEEGLDVPETYEDLLDPQYRGQILMPHPGTSGTAFSAITTWLQIYGEEEGWAYIRSLAQNVDQFTRSGRAPQNLVAQGEYPIGIGFFDAVYYLGVEGYPIEAVFPTPLFGEPFSAQVVRGSRNEERAKLFFDYLLTAEAQEVLPRYGTYPVRDDVPPPEGYPPLSELDVFDYDWQRWGALRDEILDRFVEETQVEIPDE
jgi:iron(III) transport system substrate-binding protein